MWVVVNADSEERPAGQDPSSIGEKQTNKKDDLPRAVFGPRKIPCVYFIFFFFLTAQEQKEDDFFWSGGGEKTNLLELISLVN